MKKLLKFLTGGKPLPTAPSAEQRYKGGKRVLNTSQEFGDSISIRGVEAPSAWYEYPAQIIERIRHSVVHPMFNDTVYAERPSFIRPVHGVVRAAGNNYYYGKKKRYQLPIFGDFVHNNYDKSTPEEQKEYDTLKRRFNTAWSISKQLQGGTIEKSDNTRVLFVPNNGEAVHERKPQGYGDFIPLLGTYRAAKRIDNNEPNASYGDLIVNGLMDLLGAGMVGSVVKAAGKANRIAKALKSRGFVPGSKEGIYIKLGATDPIDRASGNVKQIPTVDYYNVAMLPMIQSLRVPATYPFKGVTVVGSDLSKNYRFPYGGINVISKPINGGLDSQQKVYLNPFDGHEYESPITKKDIIQ